MRTPPRQRPALPGKPRPPRTARERRFVSRSTAARQRFTSRTMMRADLFNSPFCNAAAVMRFITLYAYRRARKTTARRAGMRLTKPGGGLGAPRRASPSASRPGRGGRRREGSAAPGHGALGGGTRPEPAGLTAPQCRRLRCARPFGGERGGTAGGEKLE